MELKLFSFHSTTVVECTWEAQNIFFLLCLKCNDLLMRQQNWFSSTKVKDRKLDRLKHRRVQFTIKSRLWKNRTEDPVLFIDYDENHGITAEKLDFFSSNKKKSVIYLSQLQTWLKKDLVVVASRTRCLDMPQSGLRRFSGQTTSASFFERTSWGTSGSRMLRSVKKICLSDFYH